jgi:hypothetical protein
MLRREGRKEQQEMRKWKRRMMGGERETRMNVGIIPRRMKIIA